MTMTPVPVLLLFFRPELAKIAMRIAVILARPLIVVNNFIVVPNVVVAVVRVIRPVIMMLGTRCAHHGRR